MPTGDGQSRSTSSVVGFSLDAVEHVRADSGRARSEATPRAVWPAATMPGSLTTSARRAPNSPAKSPSDRACPDQTRSACGWEVERNHGGRARCGRNEKAHPSHAQFIRAASLGNARERNRKSMMLPSCGCSQFELDRGNRRRCSAGRCGWRRSAARIKLLVVGDRRADQRRADLGQHLLLRAFDDGREREHVLLLRDRRARATVQCTIMGRR